MESISFCAFLRISGWAIMARMKSSILDEVVSEPASIYTYVRIERLRSIDFVE